MNALFVRTYALFVNCCIRCIMLILAAFHLFPPTIHLARVHLRIAKRCHCHKIEMLVEFSYRVQKNWGQNFKQLVVSTDLHTGVVYDK